MSSKYGKIVAEEGFISATPMPSTAELDAFYANVYYQHQASSTYQAEYSKDEWAQKILRAALLMHALDVVRGKLSRSDQFLEIGCGEGVVLAAAAEAGYSVAGLDFSSFAVEKFNPKYAKDVTTGDAFDLLDRYIGEGRKKAVCVVQNVLEHVRDPDGLFSRIAGVLEPDGHVVVTVPNDFSRIQQLATDLSMIDREYWFSPPQHLHYFNIDNLRTFCEQKGYDVVDSYGDFPIEFFLFHPGSNYVLRPESGKAAHHARIVLDLMLAERGIESYHRFCQAMTDCGVGRNVTLILRPKDSIDR
jgi:SAM-dependent methyltransferase